jgi:hypothetical protein
MMERDQRGSSLEQITEDVEIENEELTTIHEHEELEDSPIKQVKVEEFEFENDQGDQANKLEPDQNYSNF